MLSWVIATFGWLFVLATAAFLVFAGGARLQPLRPRPSRQGRRPARVPHRLVDRDDVQRRHGHRAHVLRGGGAHLASHRSARRDGEAGSEAAAQQAMAHLLLPLGAAPVGDLRDRRPGARLLHLPARDAEPDQLGVLSAARRARAWPDRQVDRHPRDLRHPVRQRHLARAGRASDQQRTRLPVGCGAGERDRRGHHRRAHPRLRPVGGVRCAPRHPVAQQHQHGAGHRPAAVPARGGPDRLPAGDAWSSRSAATSPRSSRPASGPGRSATRRGCRAGRSSTGRGGSPGRPSSARSSRVSPRAARFASSWSACCSSRAA